MKNAFIDLFAGCGGLSLGLEKAGFQPIYVNELNQDALKTYIMNRSEYPYLKDKKFFSNDIYEITSSEKKLKNLKNFLFSKFNIGENELALITGGPPCQGFSGIGHRRTFKIQKKDIPSNHLYREMVKFINVFNPKCFIFENVRGLLSSRWSVNGKKGEVFNDVLNQFKKLKNYEIQYDLLQAKNYGVPQNRPRVLLIGIRKDINFKFNKDLVASGLLPEGDTSYPNPFELLSDLIDKKYLDKLFTHKYKSDPKNNFQIKLRTKKNSKKLFVKGDILTEMEYSNHSNNIKKKFQYMIKNNGNIPIEMKTKKFAQRVIPKFWGKKGPNITTASLPDDYVHFSQPRSLTVREWARLQTFPDWYEFYGKRTTGGRRRAGNPDDNNWERDVPKYTQIGNAVPVELAYRIGSHLKKIIR